MNNRKNTKLQNYTIGFTKDNCEIAAKLNGLGQWIVVNTATGSNLDAKGRMRSPFQNAQFQSLPEAIDAGMQYLEANDGITYKILRQELECCLLDFLQSYDLAVGDKSPLNDVAKGVIRGFFIGTPERAKKLLGTEISQ
jgi:hypothetical protein